LKIVESDRADKGITILFEAGLLQEFLPELLEGIGIDQNLHHIYTVWEHNLRALKYATEKNYSIDVRLASLFHDIGKPRTKRGEGKYATFYGHEVVGAKMTAQIMDRLKFPKKQADKIIKLVRWHLFYYNVGEVTESSVRRLIAHIGKDNVEELIQLREADRIGSGVPKAKPYKLRHLEYIVDKVSSDPISVKMLAINGNELMKELSLEPGPKLGLILNSLLVKVLEDPKLNTKAKLLSLAKELDQKSENELRENLEKIEEEIEKEEEKRKKKYYVN
jgi:tRNA nucleotidyltransferase (CCA-adding enzyme)